MPKYSLKLLSYTLLCAGLLLLPVKTYAEQPKELEWEELVPEGWDPNSVFNEYTDTELIEMTAEQFGVLEAKAQAIFDAAPTVKELDGKQVKIPGFMLPLEFDGTEIKEFLLVPYFGACVHTPPPPSNQVIHAKLKEEIMVTELFEPVWISGRLNTIQSQATLGETGVSLTLEIETGYTMEVNQVEPYTESN